MWQYQPIISWIWGHGICLFKQMCFYSNMWYLESQLYCCLIWLDLETLYIIANTQYTLLIPSIPLLLLFCLVQSLLLMLPYIGGQNTTGWQVSCVNLPDLRPGQRSNLRRSQIRSDIGKSLSKECVNDHFFLPRGCMDQRVLFVIFGLYYFCCSLTLQVTLADVCDCWSLSVGTTFVMKFHAWVILEQKSP